MSRNKSRDDPTSAGAARPLRAEPPGDVSSAPGAAPGAAPGGPLRVLVVEDNPINRKLAVRFLEKRGFLADVAENGAEAVKAAGDVAYDLVLMDVQMPVMDGLEATCEIRRREAAYGRHTPIVALTANAFEDDRERCLAAGMDGFLAKPIRFNEFEATIRAVMAR